MGYYHWFWLAQPHPFPETMIDADAGGLVRCAHRARAEGPPDFFHPEALADYLAALDEPGTIPGICEDYRAAATIDLVHDRDSRAAGARIACPLLVLWGAKGRVGGWYDVLGDLAGVRDRSAPRRGGALRPLPGRGSTGRGARRVHPFFRLIPYSMRFHQ